MRHAGFVLVVSLGLAGCSLFRGTPPVEAVSPETVELERAVEPFYKALENRPLDVLETFQNQSLRSYFQTEDGFAAYYAQLAGKLRGALYRNSVAKQVQITNVQFDGADRARVDIVLIGEHERRLRTGELRLPRTDTWIRVQGRWLIAPEKL